MDDNQIMILRALASGSNGNCFLVHHDGVTVLFDAGISRKRIIEGIIELDLDPASLKYVFITHAHSDHVIGLAVLSSYVNFQVVATRGTIKELNKLRSKDERYHEVAVSAQPIKIDETLDLGNMSFTARKAVHDIQGSVGYVLDTDDGTRVCYTTDNSEVLPTFIEDMESADFLIIESNHDIDMLMRSRRSRWLKQRIRNTHLANIETRRTLKDLISSRLKVIFLVHLSGECNHPGVVAREIGSLKEYIDIKGANWDWIICPRDESSTIVRYDDNLSLVGGISSQNLDEHHYLKRITMREYLELKEVPRQQEVLENNMPEVDDFF